MLPLQGAWVQSLFGENSACYMEWVLKAAREKWRVMYKGIPIRPSMDFSADTLQASKEWHDVFKVLKGKNLQSRILDPIDLYGLYGFIWITNKVLLYSTGNPAQYYMAVWIGGEFGEWIHVYVWLSPFTVHLELSQHC